MKNMKKLASVILVLVMVLTMAVSASAETPAIYSITINNSADGYIYEAYQIFEGSIRDGKLCDITWGKSISNAASLEDAADIAARLDQNYEGSDKLTTDDILDMVQFGNPVADSGSTSNPYVISSLTAGYYLVKVRAGSLDGAVGAYSEHLVEVVKNVSVAPKSNVPVVEKKTQDINDSTDTSMSDWQDSADHDLGDNVPFQLKATLANNVADYNIYKVIFHDTMSAGLTYNYDAVIKYNGKDVTDYFTITYEGTELTFSCNNVKAFGAGNSAIITVEYTAVLNENAVLGVPGNPNEVYLEYSNNPNWIAGGDNDGDGDIDEDDEEEDTGVTPVDKVVIFTYKVIVNKVDPTLDPLAGAGFTLYKRDVDTGAWNPVGAEMKGEAMTTFTWSHLDDGVYRLVETTVPAGYNAIDPIVFSITAEHEIKSDDPRLISLSGDVISGEAEFTVSTQQGSLSTTIINQSGIELPETGGMGTTIFYVMGAVLVLGAVVLLITKKRVSMEG